MPVPHQPGRRVVLGIRAGDVYRACSTHASNSDTSKASLAPPSGLERGTSVAAGRSPQSPSAPCRCRARRPQAAQNPVELQVGRPGAHAGPAGHQPQACGIVLRVGTVPALSGEKLVGTRGVRLEEVDVAQVQFHTPRCAVCCRRRGSMVATASRRWCKCRPCVSGAYAASRCPLPAPSARPAMLGLGLGAPYRFSLRARQIAKGIGTVTTGCHNQGSLVMLS